MCNRCKSKLVEPFSNLCGNCLKILINNALDEHRDMQKLISTDFNHYVPIWNEISRDNHIMCFGFSTINMVDKHIVWERNDYHKYLMLGTLEYARVTKR